MEKLYLFGGNEHEMFLDHFSFLFSCQTKTECNSSWCPKRTIIVNEKRIQSFPESVEH